MQSIDPKQVPQGWTMRHVDGIEYGPYSSQDIAGFIAEMRVLRNSELRHATETANKWVTAERVPQFTATFTVAEPAKPAPPPVRAERKPMPPIPAPPIGKAIDMPRKRNWFPWILLGIWGLWGLAIGFNFVINMLDYDYIDSANDIIVVDGRALAISTWIGIGIFGSAIVAVILGIPALVTSVICYFFFPRVNA